MGNAMTHNVFKVTADPISCAMLISLAKDGINLGSIQIDTKEASQIAAIVLGSARDAMIQAESLLLILEKRRSALPLFPPQDLVSVQVVNQDQRC
jgi:hypothetical protein